MITILVTVYNFEHCILECLESISKQTVTNWEAIILDNGSSDNSEKIIKDYIKGDSRFTFSVNKDNTGPYPALNQMLGMVKTPYFTRVDGDDFVEPDYLERAVALMESHPLLNAVFTNFRYFPSGEVKPYPEAVPDETPFSFSEISGKSLKPGADYFSSSFSIFFRGIALCKTEKVRRLGGFEEWRTESDILMWLKLATEGKVAVIPDPLYHYRISSNSITQTVHRDSKDLFWKKTLLITLANWLKDNSDLDINFAIEVANIEREYKAHLLYRLKAKGQWWQFLKTLCTPAYAIKE